MTFEDFKMGAIQCISHDGHLDYWTDLTHHVSLMQKLGIKGTWESEWLNF